MDKQKIGYLGAGLLVVGLFLPIVSLPIVGNVTLMSNGTNLAALAILVQAGICAVLVAKDRHDALSWPASASALTVAYLFARLQYKLSDMRSDVADTLKDNPFSGMAQAAMGAVQIQWGWLVLATGAGLLVYLAIQGRKDADIPLFEIGSSGKGLFAASVATILVAPAIDAWGVIKTNASPEATESAPASAEAAAPTSATSSTADTEQASYIRDHIKIYDLEARYFDSLLDGRIPGVEFKIKNDGERTLNKVKVRVIFYDDQDKPIAEEEYYPVLVTSSGYGDDNKPLRPNYIWKQEDGKFYSAKQVPSEWKTGKVTATITEIEFGPNE